MTRTTTRQKVRRTPFVREMDDDLEALRDDCIALFLNSGLRQIDITNAGGPTPSTISKWLYKETMFPRYQTIASFARALGHKLTMVHKDAFIDPVAKGNASWHGIRRPKMPPKKRKKK
jgi:hypothetical protein